MNFDYTDELENYYLTIFHVNGIPCSAIVDKESKKVIDISTLTSGVYNGSHPYNKDTSLKCIDWIDISYYDLEEAIEEYFTTEYK